MGQIPASYHTLHGRRVFIMTQLFNSCFAYYDVTLVCDVPYFLEISPHLELSPPSKSRRVILTLNALNAALEFSPHVVKGRHYYCAYYTYVILTLILNNAQCARSPIVEYFSRRPRNLAALEMSPRQTEPRN